MKTSVYIVVMVLCGILFTQQAEAQVLKRTKKTTTKKVNEKVDENVNKAIEGIGKGLGGLLNKNKEEESVDPAKEESAAGQDAENPVQQQVREDETPVKPQLAWSKYDFVPGDKIIFEDNLVNEENGEFPSRWDLVQGTVENAELGGEDVIMFRGGSPTIIPYLKNPGIDYLPDVFTIEFDLYMPGNSLTIFFYDRKNQKAPGGASTLNVWYSGMELYPARSDLPGKADIKNRWAHIAVAYTAGKMKAYIDETRLINIPHLGFEPTGFSLHAYHASDNQPFFVKNIRIAEGGVKYYDRFLQDGKIVSNGIRFDTGKASLRPESMGVLNEIFGMMNKHPEINISIEGHTDSDGDDTLNQKLSEQRAETVMNRLVEMGIAKERLSFKGYGESKPVSPNDSPERKAENRRVEFVKSN